MIIEEILRQGQLASQRLLEAHVENVRERAEEITKLVRQPFAARVESARMAIDAFNGSRDETLEK